MALYNVIIRNRHDNVVHRAVDSSPRMDSEISNDCLGCRIGSGSGLLGASAYILFQSKSNSHKWGRLAMKVMSLGAYAQAPCFTGK